MIRVLIVDDSALVRDLLRDFFSHDAEFAVVGEAADGREALEKVTEYAPDLVTMDIDMPVMNGLEAIAAIMRRSPVPIVVITTQDDARIAYEATLNGALEFYPKALFSMGLDGAKRGRIFETLKRISAVKARSGRSFVPVPGRLKGGFPDRLSLIAIGASTGGPKALLSVLPKFPKNFPLPLALVQHNSPGFDRGFAAWLGEYCEIEVKIAEDREELRGGVLYIAPTDRHLEFSGNRLVLTDGTPVQNQRPSVDVAFRSAAKAFPGAVLSAVLTGMGRDGAEGTAAIKDSGGITISQDEATSLIWGMPKAAMETGKVDFVLPLDGIASAILEYVARIAGN